MFKLGNKEIDTKIILAPMAGITSFAYRKFMAEYGAKITYTEMISDMGLIYKNQETLDFLSFPKSSFITGVQLFGNDPKNLAKAALICQKTNKNIDFFDVNMACPVPKVTKQGSGSSLLKNPKLCGEIIKAIKAVTTLPVTAKIRLGFYNEDLNFKEVIKELESAGVDLVAIHARSAKQLYSSSPHYELLKNLKSEMKVPLVVSGNIYDIKSAVNALEITKADAVMVARGGIGNPFLITQLNHYFKSGEILPSPSLNEQKEACLHLAKYLIEEKGEERAMRIYRGIAPKFFSGYPNIKKLRQSLSNEISSYDDLKKIIDNI